MQVFGRERGDLGENYSNCIKFANFQIEKIENKSKDENEDGTIRHMFNVQSRDNNGQFGESLEPD